MVYAVPVEAYTALFDGKNPGQKSGKHIRSEANIREHVSVLLNILVLNSFFCFAIFVQTRLHVKKGVKRSGGL